VSQVRRAIITLAVAAAACAFGVPAATAGQIVWVQAAGNGAQTLWAANDDGTYPHRVLAASASELLPQFPVFGICLGHQMITHALGGTTFKLKFGHRGGNQPVKNVETGKVSIRKSERKWRKNGIE